MSVSTEQKFSDMKSHLKGILRVRFRIEGIIAVI